MVVDLPAPLRPRSAVAPPARTSKDTPATATTEPKLTLRSPTLTTAVTGKVCNTHTGLRPSTTGARRKGD